MRAKVLAILMVLTLASGITLADTQREAVAKVWVDVVANVAIGFVDNGDLGMVQTGQFGKSLLFRIDANTETVDIFVTVSNLYKGDDATNDDVAPILVDASAGVGVAPANGHEVDGGDDWLSFTGPTEIDGFAAMMTETGRFESSQNGHFSQTVAVTPTWNQDDPEKPMGEYSGYVMVTCMVVPDAAPAS